MIKYSKKGDKIYVEGRLRSRQWQTEDGSQKSTVEIIVTEFTFLSTKKNADAQKNAALNLEEIPQTPETPVRPINDLPF